MMGLTFKENCPDLRNSKVADVVTRAEEVRREGRRLRPVDRRRGSASTSTASSRFARRPRAATTRSCWRSRTRSSAKWASTRSAASRSKPHVLYDIKYVFDGRRGRRTALASGAAAARTHARARPSSDAPHAADQAVEVAGRLLSHRASGHRCRADQILPDGDHQSAFRSSR